MKRYQSHKIVEAAQITSTNLNIDGGGVVRYLEPTSLEKVKTVTVPPGFCRPGTYPEIGDYLVRYDGDYLSWSPKDKFEAGYTEVEGGAIEGNVLTSSRLIAAGRAAGGKPSTVEVTVTAPEGRRASVALIGQNGKAGEWTVTGGQSQTWAVIGPERLEISQGKPHSNVEQVFSPD